MILGSLLAHCTREYISELLLTAIIDCPNEPRQRMSFVETNPHLANGKERMGERWRKQRGCSPQDSGITDKFIWEEMRQRFLRVLFLLCYFTAGQPFWLMEALYMTLYSGSWKRQKRLSSSPRALDTYHESDKGYGCRVLCCEVCSTVSGQITSFVLVGNSSISSGSTNLSLRPHFPTS